MSQLQLKRRIPGPKIGPLKTFYQVCWYRPEDLNTGNDTDSENLKDVKIATKTSTNIGLQQDLRLRGLMRYDADIASHYHALKYHLFELGYPETVDRTRAPRAAKDAPREKAVVAVLHRTGKTTSICLEGYALGLTSMDPY
ncbi:hypothetical protein DPMN_176122 [Dreissena polymorpha]|uniref:Uncharacterized protein n=1 Tax=Dreissena polymorpha TaxID=45954 RepID=A0A9D4E9I7_DREPO|nr:hypothetical protein DPMN_176122 [Dreissena polymorpha]